MALPTPEKTWQHDVNNAVAAGGTDLDNYESVLLGIKNAMVGFASNPWTVEYSSQWNGVGMVVGTEGDNVDRWTVGGHLHWGRTADDKSWIVLKQTGIASNFQVCISLNTATSFYTNEGLGLEIAVSPSAGFTGGTATARPTATDEVVVNPPAMNWVPNYTTAWASVYHVQQSSDGAITRVFIERNGVCISAWSFEAPGDTVTGWTLPWCSMFVRETSTVTTNSCTRYQNLNDTQGIIGSHSGTEFEMFLTSETSVSQTVGERQTTANDISGEWPILTAGLESTDAAGKGRHGRLVDLWWGSTDPENGSTYPSGGSRTHRHVGNIIVPWNGTIPTVT